MFTNEANFTNIDPKNRIYVSQVAHKVYVDVNEQGTEAAAATGILLKRVKTNKGKKKILEE